MFGDSIAENLLVAAVLSFPLLFILNWSWFGVFLVKVFTVCGDFLTLTGHIFWQRPWNARIAMERIRGYREDEDDPESPFIRFGDPIPFDREIIDSPTISHWFDIAVKKYGDRACIGTRQVLREFEEQQSNGKALKKYLLADEYSFINYKQVKDKVKQITAEFILNGVGPGDKVVLFCETREEWLLSAFAVWRLGAITVTVYANLGLDGIVTILEQTQAKHMVTSFDSLSKLIKIADKISSLKTVFCAHGPGKKVPVSCFELEKFNLIPFDQLYKNSNDSEQQNFVRPEPQDIACIMYTSGSTGVPKGVLITHCNFMEAMKALIVSCIGDYKYSEHEAYLAYLPLAHIFEMGAEVLMFSIGIPICYSSPQTMMNNATGIAKGCKGDMSTIKPTIMPAVPLVLDRIKKTIEDKISESDFTRDLFLYSMEYRKFWYYYGFETPIIDHFVFRKIREAFGGNLKLMFVGGAPLSSDTQEFITISLGIKLIQGYAATEATACAVLMDLDDRSLGRCGGPLFGAKVALKDWPEGNYLNSDKPNPRGELLIGGPAVTMGYYKNEEETEKVYWVDEYGMRWWKSGDIGEVFPDGTIKIIDRKKDLIKLQHGEYISLGKVESVLKDCQYIDNICVYGDSFHNYLIAFVLPERNCLLRLAETMGKQEMVFGALCSDRQMIKTVLETLRDFGESKGLLKFELPNRIKLCSEEWTPDNGLVTAALKIRRLQIQQFYQHSIQELYSVQTS